jgi:SAM-dependent methyltransferase
MRMDTNTTQLAQANAHKTAIRRFRGLSIPMRILNGQHTAILANKDVLDYGCGRGEDVDALHFAKFDPHFFPNMPEGQFDVVVNNYVLNVLPIDKQDELIAKILAKVKTGGKAYITVRRDVKKEGFTSKGTFQRNVTLNYPIVLEKKGQFCMYVVTK